MNSIKIKIFISAVLITAVTSIPGNADVFKGIDNNQKADITVNSVQSLNSNNIINKNSQKNKKVKSLDVRKLTVEDSVTLIVKFSKTIDEESGCNILNYTLSGIEGIDKHPLKITLSKDKKKAVLTVNTTESNNKDEKIKVDIANVTTKDHRVLRACSADAEAIYVEKSETPEDKAYAAINNGTGTIDDYELIGISKDIVNEDNYLGINSGLKDKNIRTTEDLLSLIGRITEAYANITSEGTLEDYKTMGISGITESNMSIVNNRMRDYFYEYIWQGGMTINLKYEKINELIKSIDIAYDNINKGEADSEDYWVLMGTNEYVTSYNYQEINKYLKGKSINDYETMREAIIDAYNQLENDKVNAPVKNIKEGNASIDDYISLGIGTTDIYSYSAALVVNPDNYMVMNSVLKGKDFQSVDSLKDEIMKISSVLKKIDAMQLYYSQKIEMTIEDYNILGVNVVNDDQLAAANAVILYNSFSSANDKVNYAKEAIGQSI